MHYIYVPLDWVGHEWPYTNSVEGYRSLDHLEYELGERVVWYLEDEEQGFGALFDLRFKQFQECLIKEINKNVEISSN